MSAFDRAWVFLRKAVDYDVDDPMSYDVPVSGYDQYDKEYDMFGGSQGLRDQHEAYLNAYHGGHDKYAGMELPGKWLGDEDEEPPMTFDEFARYEIENMKDFKSMPYFMNNPEKFRDEYGEMIDNESNY